jgi:hypothetical protein
MNCDADTKPVIADDMQRLPSIFDAALELPRFDSPLS